MFVRSVFEILTQDYLLEALLKNWIWFCGTRELMHLNFEWYVYWRWNYLWKESLESLFMLKDLTQRFHFQNPGSLWKQEFDHRQLVQKTRFQNAGSDRIQCHPSNRRYKRTANSFRKIICWIIRKFNLTDKGLDVNGMYMDMIRLPEEGMEELFYWLNQKLNQKSLTVPALYELKAFIEIRINENLYHFTEQSEDGILPVCKKRNPMNMEYYYKTEKHFQGTLPRKIMVSWKRKRMSPMFLSMEENCSDNI